MLDAYTETTPTTAPLSGTIYDKYANLRVCIPLEAGRERPLIAILQTAYTDSMEVFNQLPEYLRYALEHNADYDNKDTITVLPVFAYVRYPDLKRIIGMIFDDALITNNGDASAPEFLMELTGYKFKQEGIPDVDEDGNPIRLRNPPNGLTRYEEMFDLKPGEIQTLIESLLDGLLNEDPRVRLTCSAVLEGIGAHPKMHEAYKKAMEQEMVGNIFENAPFLPRNVNKSRHNYANINGCEEDDIPYRRFIIMDRKITRLKSIYYMEETREITPEEFSTMSAQLFNAISDDTMFLPNYPLVYDNDFALPDETIPFEYYLKRQYILPELRRRTIIPITVEDIEPLNPDIRDDMLRRRDRNDDFWTVRREGTDILVNIAKYDEAANKQTAPNQMTDNDFYRILGLFIGGLDNPDFTVQKKCARFLKLVLESSDIEITQHLKIQIAYTIQHRGLANLDYSKIANLTAEEIENLKPTEINVAIAN